MTVADLTVGSIGHGLVILVGVAFSDTREDAIFLARKITGLRIFDDAAGRMNQSVVEANGEILIVSQFTLYGDTRKGRRPSYIQAAGPELAKELYEFFVDEIRKVAGKVETGQFQAMMDVELVNHGPVTLMIESEKKL